MERRQLGRTGLRVSRLGLGTMTWSRDTDEHEAREQLRAFLDAGGNLLDTAAFYADGAAEELIGSLLSGEFSRAEVLLCSKAGVRRDADGSTVDASRASLLDALDASLLKLGTDHLDLWLVQAPDPRTPLTETLSALRTALSSGRARYVGLSNHPAWQTAQAATLLAAEGWELATVEVEYSLLQREAEREVLPACAGLGVGVLAWSPLGRGVLTGKYRRSIPADSRAASAHLAGFVEPYLTTRAAAVVNAVVTAAEGLGASPLEVALAWVRDADRVTSAIVGARTAAQLRASLTAEQVTLPEPILAALDAVSSPAPAG